jgi:hypothetical protein
MKKKKAAAPSAAFFIAGHGKPINNYSNEFM